MQIICPSPAQTAVGKSSSHLEWTPRSRHDSALPTSLTSFPTIFFTSTLSPLAFSQLLEYCEHDPTWGLCPDVPAPQMSVRLAPSLAVALCSRPSKGGLLWSPHPQNRTSYHFALCQSYFLKYRPYILLYILTLYIYLFIVCFSHTKV